VGLAGIARRKQSVLPDMKASTILSLALIMLGIMAFACQVTT